MDSIFSFLFRFPPADDYRQRPFNDHTEPYQEDGDHDGNFFGFHAFPFNHDDLFRQFDETFNRMMKNFGAFDGHPPDEEQGDFHIIPSLPSPHEHDVLPRDRMLKQPDSDNPRSPKHDYFGPFQQFDNFDRGQETRKDSDLDDSVRSGGLGKIFKKSPAQELTPAEPKTSRFFHSVSVRTHRDADGRVEEKHTVVDGHGTQTTVTRSVDGQTVRQTTIQKNSGEQETIEDLINVDENDKNNFEQRWQSPGASNPMQVMPKREDALRNAGDASIFHRLFSGLLYPGSRKD